MTKAYFIVTTRGRSSATEALIAHAHPHATSAHERPRIDCLHGAANGSFGRIVCHDDEWNNAPALLFSFMLNDRGDRNLLLPQQSSNLCQHAGPIVDAEPQ